MIGGIGIVVLSRTPVPPRSPAMPREATGAPVAEVAEGGGPRGMERLGGGSEVGAAAAVKRNCMGLSVEATAQPQAAKARPHELLADTAQPCPRHMLS